MSWPRSAPRAASSTRERVGCYIHAMPRPSRHNRRVGRSKRVRKATGVQPLLMSRPSSEEANLKRLPSKDLPSLAVVVVSCPSARGSQVLFGRWGYRAQHQELHRQHERMERYMICALANTQVPTPAAPRQPMDDALARSSPCIGCEAAVATDMCELPFHWCVTRSPSASVPRSAAHPRDATKSSPVGQRRSSWQAAAAVSGASTFGPASLRKDDKTVAMRTYQDLSGCC